MSIMSNDLLKTVMSQKVENHIKTYLVPSIYQTLDHRNLINRIDNLLILYRENGLSTDALQFIQTTLYNSIGRFNNVSLRQPIANDDNFVQTNVARLAIVSSVHNCTIDDLRYLIHYLDPNCCTPID